MEEFIHASNKKRIFSFLSPEGENWTGVNEPGANFLYKKKMFGFCLFVVGFFLAPFEKQNQLNAIMKMVFKICTGFELLCALPLQQILIKAFEIIPYKWSKTGIK